MKLHRLIFLVLCTLLGLTGTVCAQNVTVPPTPNANQLTDSLTSVYIINTASGNSNTNLSSYDAWATGQNGVILHWDGQKWIQLTSATTDNLYSIYMINSTNGWAVGGTLTKGIILHFDGQNWTEWKNIYNPSTNNATITSTLNSVAFDDSGTTGWIVGAQGSVYQWNSSSWIGTPQLNVTLRAISIPAHSNDAWIVGNNGTILHWTGSTWAQVNSTVTSTIRSIAVENSSSGWAVGGDDGVGLLLSLNSTGWSKWSKVSFTPNSTSDKVNVTLNSISMATSGSGWVVGEGGWILQWNGSVWVGTTGKTSNALTSVSSARNVTSAAWAVGGSGTILGWNGNQWSTVHATDIPELTWLVLTILLGATFLGFLGAKSGHLRKRVSS